MGFREGIFCDITKGLFSNIVGVKEGTIVIVYPFKTHQEYVRTMFIRNGRNHCELLKTREHFSLKAICSTYFMLEINALHHMKWSTFSWVTMYLHSRVELNMKKPIRTTRAVTKMVFKTASKCSGKYLNSPFYKGTLLWDKLDNDLQRMNNVKQFLQELKKSYTVYQEMW